MYTVTQYVAMGANVIASYNVLNYYQQLIKCIRKGFATINVFSLKIYYLVFLLIYIGYQQWSFAFGIFCLCSLLILLTVCWGRRVHLFCLVWKYLLREESRVVLKAFLSSKRSGTYLSKLRTTVFVRVPYF